MKLNTQKLLDGFIGTLNANQLHMSPGETTAVVEDPNDFNGSRELTGTIEYGATSLGSTVAGHDVPGSTIFCDNGDAVA